jgi:hypothetical protein
LVSREFYCRVKTRALRLKVLLFRHPRLCVPFWDVYTNLDVPGSFGITAYEINDAGQIVGDYSEAGGFELGFLATPAPEPASILLLSIGTLGDVDVAAGKAGGID